MYWPLLTEISLCNPVNMLPVNAAWFTILCWSNRLPSLKTKIKGWCTTLSCLYCCLLYRQSQPHTRSWAHAQTQLWHEGIHDDRVLQTSSDLLAATHTNSLCHDLYGKEKVMVINHHGLGLFNNMHTRKHKARSNVWACVMQNEIVWLSLICHRCFLQLGVCLSQWAMRHALKKAKEPITCACSAH